MVSGIPTASGYEERIRFSELEVVERGANEQGLLVNTPEGHFINGWDVNVAAVRTTSVKRTVRYHQHAVSTPSSPHQHVGIVAYQTTLGIPSSSQTSWRIRQICRPSIRRVLKATETLAYGAARKDLASVTEKEQEFYELQPAWCWWCG